MPFDSRCVSGAASLLDWLHVLHGQAYNTCHGAIRARQCHQRWQLCQCGTSTVIGTGIDIATGAVTHPKTTELITLVHPKTGVAQDLIWREGMNIYTARRALDIRFAPSTFKLIRNNKTLTAKFDTALQAGDIVHFQKP